jgi:hypothetical protein
MALRDKMCASAFADGQTVKLSDLLKIAGEPGVDPKSPGVYFFASVNAPAFTPFVFNLVRQGECYPMQIRPTNISADPGQLKIYWDYVRSGRMVDDLARIFDVTKVNSEIGVSVSEGAAKFDAKVMPVITPSANSFPIYDVRNVLCPGVIQAVLTDVNGRVVSGENPVRKLFVAE